MKPTKISYAIIGISVIWIILAFIQWRFNYPDQSQLLFALGFGVIGILIAYLHTWMRNTDSEIKDLHRGLDNCLDYSRTEIEKLNRT